MEKVTTQLDIDVRHPRILYTVRVQQGDTARELQVRLSDGGVPYAIQPDAYAVLLGRKPDGTSLYNTCRIRENGIFYSFTDQTCAVPGTSYLQIRLHGGDGKLLTTVPVTLEVYENVFGAEDAQKSQDEQTVLSDLVDKTRAIQLDILHDLETGAYNGESAYRTAVKLGYQGTEQEWADSLRYDHSEEFQALADQVRDHKNKAESYESQCMGHASFADVKARYASRSAGNAERSASAAAASADRAKQEADRAAGFREIPVVESQAESLTLQPNTMYQFPRMARLSVTLGPEKPGVVNHYLFSFRSGPVPTVLEVPAAVKWPVPPVVEAEKTYQVSIMGNLGVMAGA